MRKRRFTGKPKDLILLCGLGLSFCAAGCASTSSTRSTDLALDARGDLQSIITQPFNDFNLVRTEIPESLMRVAGAPYENPSPLDCDHITAELAELDAVLGAEAAAKPAASSEPIIGRQAAERAARNAARGAATSWIPFRGFVREVTGAERHARSVREAVLAGMLRRAFLKGMRAELTCNPEPQE